MVLNSQRFSRFQADPEFAVTWCKAYFTQKYEIILNN
jgi:hypothetical protein